MNNVRLATNPLSINLPNGGIIHSTHVCDIDIQGLPMTLTGHIVPGLSMASLMGIRILCKAGCKIIFTDTKCVVKYNGNVILTRVKDPTTNLWMLPITPAAINEVGTDKTSQKLLDGPIVSSTPEHPLVGKDLVDHKNPPPINWAVFAHSICTQANAVQIAHQSLGNPKISTLMKALRKGFLKGCPNINEELGAKYLNPSPATAKGHMKRPKKGIRSTAP
jgi:hypothetical protein